MKYRKLQHLIDLWAAYEAAHPDGTTAGFGLWLQQQNAVTTDSLEVTTGKPAAERLEAESQPLGDTVPAHLPVTAQLAALAGRIGRMGRVLSKTALAELGLGSQEEFTFLASIYYGGSPTKSAVIQHNLTEMTTGTEILRRLQKAGWTTERPDDTDRRAKRISLTPSGEQVILRAFREMSDMAAEMFAPLTAAEQETLHRLLHRIDQHLLALHQETQGGKN